MTFYEAALRVLEAAGQPLTSVEITERSVAQGLLSHVGKTPEQTMVSRLAAMARRARDRQVTVTAPDTFALTAWGLDEDAAALEAMSAPYEHPEEGLPPLRPVERHPEPHNENVRGIGRQERRRRHEEEERGRKRKYPPIPEVAFELLGEADAPLAPSEVLRLARERRLASDELQPQALLSSLAEENQRRIDAGRRPNFALDPTGALMLERDDAPVAEVQATFARALDLAFSDGRIAFRQPPETAPEPLVDDGLSHAAKSAVKEARRSTARALRAHLASLEPGTLEKACAKMLHALHFREIKVAKRGNHGQLLTARRKDGSLELRWAIRIQRGNGPVDRRAIQDCRRDLQHQSAHAALLIATGELRSDARSEALSGAPVHVWAGEGLAEKFLESHSGVRVLSLELFELDPSFFEEAARRGEESRRRREERHREREERDERPVHPEPSEPAAAEEAAPAEEDLGDEGEGDEEGPEETGPEGAAAAGTEGAPGAPGEPGERKRRRRRRRGRRGRGREAAPGAPGASDPSAGGSAPAGSAGAQEPAAESSETPSEPPSGGGQSSAPEQG